MTPLRFDELTPAWFERCFRETLGESSLTVSSATPFDSVLGDSLIIEGTAESAEGLVGLFPFSIDLVCPGRDSKQVAVMLKSKAHDSSVIGMGVTVARMACRELAEPYVAAQESIFFKNCHLKELWAYGQKDARFTRHVPKVYGIWSDPDRHAYVVVLEYMDADGFRLKDTADDVSGWTDGDVRTVIDGLAELHAIHFDQVEPLLEEAWLGPVFNRDSMLSKAALFEGYVCEFESSVSWFTAEDAAERRRLIQAMPSWLEVLEQCPKTLVHHDCNPRNIALRRLPNGGSRLCLYDWELATIHVPQSDLAEFLIFILQPGQFSSKAIERCVEYHRGALERESGTRIDATAWREGFRCAVYDQILFRFQTYLMFHSARPFGFLERTYQTIRELIPIVDRMR
jgi:hydroxymethylglutaryl-CoA reductase (NADPH)